MKRYSEIEAIQSAYECGHNHGHGFACHNVPTLGSKLWTESMGRVTVTAENIREVHADACCAAESNSRSFTPFEFTAHEFNSADNAEALWEAFDAGASDAIQNDLTAYTDEDYGIETEGVVTMTRPLSSIHDHTEQTNRDDLADAVKHTAKLPRNAPRIETAHIDDPDGTRTERAERRATEKHD